MKFFTFLDRIDKINRLVKNGNTGSPGEFASKLGVSRTSLYELIDELRSRGAPIVYSKSTKTFFYREPFDISITCNLKPLTDKEGRTLSGGTYLLSDFGLFFSFAGKQKIYNF